jgi:hypothetical protein
MSPNHCVSWQRTADWKPADEVSRHACKINYPFVSMLDNLVRKATADDWRNWSSSPRKEVIFGMVGLLVMSIYGGESLICLICFTLPVIYLPYYLRFLSLFVVFSGSWLGYEISGFVFGGNFFLCICMVLLHLPVLCVYTIFSTYGFFGPLDVGYSSLSFKSTPRTS